MDRKAHWERVYREKSPQIVSWYQAEPASSLALVRDAVPSPEARIIDVGGGASMLVDRLLDAGYQNLAVLDLADAALAHTRQRLGARAEEIEWFGEDVTSFQAPHPFDLWHDRAVFHFLTEEEEQIRYRETLLRTLAPGGHLILATFAVGGPDRCSGLEVAQYNTERILSLFGDDFDPVRMFEETHVTPGRMTQRFAYFSLVRH